MIFSNGAWNYLFDAKENDIRPKNDNPAHREKIDAGYRNYQGGDISSTAEDLCCCEYLNSKGERSHLLALFCDCAELDDAVDRWVNGVAIPSSRAEEIMRVVEDR